MARRTRSPFRALPPEEAARATETMFPSFTSFRQGDPFQQSAFPFEGGALPSEMRQPSATPTRRPVSTDEAIRRGLLPAQEGRIGHTFGTLRPPTPPTPGGGGAGGAGGAGRASGSGLGHIAAAQQQAAAALGQLDALFEERKQMLREEYQFEETPEERATMQHLLAIIEVQREEGTKVIERVYGQAIEDAAVRAEETRARGEEAGARTRETFQDAAAGTAELMGELGERFGGAMGAGGEPLSPVAEAAVSDLQRQAEIEAAFDERMFGVTADDIGVLGEAMRPEMGAQVGALQRTAAQTSALSQVEHDRQVQQRIAAERMAYNQTLQQLAMMFDQRQFGLEDQQMALSASAAEIEAANARHAAGIRAQQAGQVSPEDQMRFEREMMEFERALEQWEQQQRQVALRGLGATPQQAHFADSLGLGQQVGEELLFGPSGPFGNPIMNQLMAGQ